MRGTKQRQQQVQPVDLCKDVDLAIECEAFLSGAWGARTKEQGRSLPCWAWLNEAAHADTTALRAAAAGAARSTPRDAEDVRVLVARALLAATRGSELRGVQRCVLVPLELELMRSDASPRRVVELATQALFS